MNDLPTTTGATVELSIHEWDQVLEIVKYKAMTTSHPAVKRSTLQLYCKIERKVRG